MLKIWNKWKIKWKVETDRRMLWIFLIFAITGSTTVIVRKSIFKFFNISIENDIIHVIVKLVMIYVVYQLLLLLIGTIMGEGKFVRWFLAKMNNRLIPKQLKK